MPSITYYTAKVYFNGYEVKPWNSINLTAGIGQPARCSIRLPFLPELFKLPLLTKVTVTVVDGMGIERILFTGFPINVVGSEEGIIVNCEDAFSRLRYALLQLLPVSSQGLSQAAVSRLQVLGEFIAFMDGSAVLKVDTPALKLDDLNRILTDVLNELTSYTSQMSALFDERINEHLKAFMRMKLSLIDYIERLLYDDESRYGHSFAVQNRVHRMIQPLFSAYSMVMMEKRFAEFANRILQATQLTENIDSNVLRLVQEFIFLFGLVPTGTFTLMTPHEEAKNLPDWSMYDLTSRFYTSPIGFYGCPPVHIVNLDETNYYFMRGKALSPTRYLLLGQLLQYTSVYTMHPTNENSEEDYMSTDISLQFAAVYPFYLQRRIKEKLDQLGSKVDLEGFLKGADISRENFEMDLGSLLFSGTFTDREIFDGVFPGIKIIDRLHSDQIFSILNRKDLFNEDYAAFVMGNFLAQIKQDSILSSLMQIVTTFDDRFVPGFPVFLVGSNYSFYGVVHSINMIMTADQGCQMTITLAGKEMISNDDFLYFQGVMNYKVGIAGKDYASFQQQFSDSLEIYGDKILWWDLEESDYIPPAFSRAGYYAACRYVFGQDPYKLPDPRPSETVTEYLRRVKNDLFRKRRAFNLGQIKLLPIKNKVVDKTVFRLEDVSDYPAEKYVKLEAVPEETIDGSTVIDYAKVVKYKSFKYVRENYIKKIVKLLNSIRVVKKDV